MSRYIDIDDDRNCYCGMDGEYEKYNIHPNVLEESYPERKKGEWVDECSCSICHWIHENDDGFALLTNYNYCPNCGADMRGDEE